MLFGANTLGAHGTLCYTGVRSPHKEGEGKFRKIWPIVDLLHISGKA